ncbi:MULTISPECIES: hypothetical protein [unclassified Granulicatella]|uniref:hypothetical protein n=1 Tax=unclassified Granulicatella TaxID=2630493 RepID=UPI00107389F0|nr:MULTISPECIES: hypothetical protein [unclassified Granulicatella]MBF0780493.1 hypothetical protein [Granulicatella sp. 19428wC4_WM01]TFU95352.1 hypothetical protein E4T68_05245 [Granulicatella sp. WM01]
MFGFLEEILSSSSTRQEQRTSKKVYTEFSGNKAKHQNVRKNQQENARIKKRNKRSSKKQLSQLEKDNVKEKQINLSHDVKQVTEELSAPLVRTQRNISKKSKTSLKKAFIYSEIFGKPKGLQ